MRALAFVLALALAGCNHGNADTKPGYLAPIAPQVGTPATFDVLVLNNSLWEIEIPFVVSGPGGTWGVPTIPPGSSFVFHLSYMPSFVQITAITTATPSYTFPTRTLVLGMDYNSTDPGVSLGFPYP